MISTVSSSSSTLGNNPDSISRCEAPLDNDDRSVVAAAVLVTGNTTSATRLNNDTAGEIPLVEVLGANPPPPAPAPPPPPGVPGVVKAVESPVLADRCKGGTCLPDKLRPRTAGDIPRIDWLLVGPRAVGVAVTAVGVVEVEKEC